MVTEYALTLSALLLVTACSTEAPTNSRSEPPSFRKDSLGKEEIESCARFRALAGRDRNNVARSIARFLPTCMDSNSFEVDFRKMPYCISAVQLTELLGKPDERRRFADFPNLQELYRMTHRDPTSGFLNDFEWFVYELGQDGNRPCWQKLTITLYEGCVVSHMITGECA